MQNVELYSKNNNYQKFAARKFYNIFGDAIKSNFGNRDLSLIDIGSGCGRILTEVTIAESGLKFSKIVGVDKSEKMLNFSNETYGSDSMSFCYMDVEGGVPEKLKGQKFDLATSFHVIHHVKDVKKAFETVYDLLDENGIFGCIFLIYHPFMSAWDALIEKYPIMKTWRDYFTPVLSVEDPDEVLKEYLQKSGFEILDFIGGTNEIFDWQTPENLERAINTINPFFTSMTEEMQKEYSKDLMTKVFEAQKTESLLNPYKVAYFIARKSGNEIIDINSRVRA